MTSSKVERTQSYFTVGISSQKVISQITDQNLPLGQGRIWGTQRSEPDIQHCWSERSCQALAGWRREGQGDVPVGKKGFTLFQTWKN